MAHQTSYYTILLLVIITSCVTLQSHGQPTMQELGNIWIVTIDKSGSMKDNKSNYQFEQDCKSTISIIDNFGIKDKINFARDVFYIYNTGVCSTPYKQYLSMGKQAVVDALEKDGPFYDLFIHPFLINHRLNNYKQLQGVIKDNLLHQPYIYRLSFVSQIRVAALQKTLELLDKKHLNNSYNNIYILTITDDADANDQWQNDYRLIKRASRNRLDEINSSQNKLIYNPLNQRGGGILEELNYNDSKSIHAYLYQYQSEQQISDCIIESSQISENISITNIQDQNLKTTLCKQECKAYQTVYWQIDSVIINGKTIPTNTGTHNPDKYIKTHIPKDLLSDININTVSLYGNVQALYRDSILGSHYRLIPFETHRHLCTSTQNKIQQILLCILILFLSCLLLYLLIIRPRTLIFKIYLNDSRIVSVLRGYSNSYKRCVPIFLQISCNNNTSSYLVSHHHHIKQKHVKGLSITTDKLVIVSRVPLPMPNSVFIGDVYDAFIDHSADIPEALLFDYNHSIQKKLIDLYKHSGNRSSQIWHLLIQMANRFYPKYYYWTSETIENTQIVLESPLKKGTLFVLDRNQQCETGDSKIEQILQSYYHTHSLHQADILISKTLNKAQNTIDLDVCSMENPEKGVRSIKNVTHLYHYEFDNETRQIDLITRELIRHLKKSYKKERILCFNHTYLDTYNQHLNFNIHHPELKSFIIFIEESGQKKSQVVYSPFKVETQFVSLKSTNTGGYLYISPLPSIKIMGSDFKPTRLGNNTVRINTGTTYRLEFITNQRKTKITTIYLGQNKINIQPL